MSSRVLLLVLLAALLGVHALDEDFDFDLSDDLQVEFEDNSRRLWKNKEIRATVGKTFHLVVPKDAFGPKTHSYEAKSEGGRALPAWLLFDKSGGVFWGVPLQENVGPLKIAIRGFRNSQKSDFSEELTIIVDDLPEAGRKCVKGEDITVLTLRIDRGVKAIKPKQRVVAINNIAKFFGLPFSAFTLKPELERDDITDSSVVLAGPGDIHGASSATPSLLQVPVGCDGRLWVQTATMVHQLKQQARDGTISEVMGLPVLGWRVKIQTAPVLRPKRQVDDYGSGDYDEDFYDDNYDDDEYDEEGPQKPTTPTSTSTTPGGANTQTHPHRHHHGESLNPSEDAESDFSPVIQEHHPEGSSTTPIPITHPIVPEIPKTEPISSTTSRTTTTTSTTTTQKPAAATTPDFDEDEEQSRILPSGKVPSSSPTPSLENKDSYYEYTDYDSETEDDVESETVVPNLPAPKQPTTVENHPRIMTETSSTTTERSTTKETTTVEMLPTTIESHQPVIVEDTEPPPVVIETTLPEQETTTSVVVVSSSEATTTSTTTSTSTISSTSSTTTPAPSTTLQASMVPSTLPAVTLPDRNITDIIDEEETTVKMTTARHVLSTPRTTTVREIVEIETKNFQPYIENRLKQMFVIAGKIFRFVIPKDTFSDLEDGANLTVEFLNAKGEPLANNSWCHYNPLRREIYGLPLDEDVSKWEYEVRATDREGASVSDHLTIQVQQHKSQRVFNHEFSLYIRIEKYQEFSHHVDWCLKTLRALGRIYNTNMSEITVRNVNYTGDLAVFTWTNDSVATNHCPSAEIEQLFKLLTANDRGDPSRELNHLLQPELRAKKVTKRGLGVCETPQVVVTPPTNFPPFLRNPVDHINATVGELLVFRVPDDTFYDPEDTDSRSLNISLLTSDRQPLKANSWLQFDSKNREFFGIPRKIGRSEYHLVCVDSAGLPATDSLEIVVYPAPKLHYNVEFSMTVEIPFESFVNSASMQRKFVEKLQDIFGDQNSTFLHLNPFRQSHQSTIITWHNKTLSTSKCPSEEIRKLESLLKNHDRSISSRVQMIMEPEFPVSSLKVVQTGVCKTKVYVPPPPVLPPDDAIIPMDEKTPEATADEYQYLMTFIVPAVIISVMLFLAAVAACVLYRRRRTGKMNVEEDGRQSYGNKGIPVIFQEELEEKPEPGTKTPVILKDEKPPLAPPEYSKSGSLKLTDDSEPYQPPPPFTRTQDNGRQPRPKPTPTYRKPPPYVPP